MHNNVLAAVSSERIVQSRLSVVVTEECVVVPSFSGQPNTVLSLDSITKIKVVKTSYPSLAVIAASLFLVAAAAASSKQGSGAGLPVGVLATVFLAAYLVLQKARVVFMNGWEATQTISGSFAEAADLIDAVATSRRNLMNASAEKLVTPGFFGRLQQWTSGLFSARIRTVILDDEALVHLAPLDPAST